MNIHGRIAVVSGGSSGIGNGTAKALARRGAHVVLLARSEDELSRATTEIQEQGGNASAYSVDVADIQAVKRVTANIRQEVGVPDILVNSAGTGKWRNILETDPEEAKYMMDVVCLGAFYLTQCLLPDMLVRKKGHIVNVTSVASYLGWPGAIGYAASRWAMRGFTEALRQEVHGTGVDVTLYASSTVRTKYFEHNPGVSPKIFQGTPLVPILSADAVGEAIAQAIEKRQRVLILPPAMSALVRLNTLFPGLAESMLRKTLMSKPLNHS